MAKKYRAIYLPDEKGRENWNKDGFNSYEEAEKYTFDFRCDACRKYWSNPKDCSCMAEWHIEEYEE